MGTIYFVGCRDCKVYRDLDKFYAMRPAEDRKEVLELADFIKSNHNFRAALLASFMAEHTEHNCTGFTEHEHEYEVVHDQEWKRESEKFWNELPEEKN